MPPRRRPPLARGEMIRAPSFKSCPVPNCSAPGGRCLDRPNRWRHRSSCDPRSSDRCSILRFSEAQSTDQRPRARETTSGLARHGAPNDRSRMTVAGWGCFPPATRRRRWGRRRPLLLHLLPVGIILALGSVSVDHGAGAGPERHGHTQAIFQEKKCQRRLGLERITRELWKGGSNQLSIR